MATEDDFTRMDGTWMAEIKGKEHRVADSMAPINALCPAVEFLFGRPPNALSRTAATIEPKVLGQVEVATKGAHYEQVMGGMNPQQIEWTRLPARGADFVDSNQWAAFCVRFDKSAQQAGCTIEQSKTLVAAMRELSSNVHEHSGAPETIFIAYQSNPNSFEFSVADAGRGVLASLRTCKDFTGLQDSQAALGALMQGASRHGAGHGGGYREVFRVLERCAGFIRCRSGDAVLSWKTGTQALIVERPAMVGLVVSVAACI